ncbi:histone deposition protein Asf1 [Nadsonia fulvescens var. elongata DSM 6958]|uniref:Histone chaperone n=1 Tax=Nadsonia fulvescens var. elongata DSM 6958 TaxID=857566 RepID=A0A1E3PMN7_9ASCO|nr:histone deposition protein Asf1 [Nadsonia fulvescens var. elongata DSM 6958]
MSIVSLLNVSVLNNPAKFTDPYEFEITFECLENLKEDLEWKLTYVGSSTSFEHDQELDSLLVGPIPVGVNKFIFTADPPSPDLIPASELVSVTVILLSCSYSGREFVRVGYYVNNEYDTEELRLNPPSKVQVDHVARNILAEKPRVTRFNIVWDNETTAIDEFPPEQQEADLAEDDEEMYAAEEDDDEEEGFESEDVAEEESTAQADNITEAKNLQSETPVTEDGDEDLEEDLEEEEIDIEEEIGEESEDESDAAAEKTNETSPGLPATPN